LLFILSVPFCIAEHPRLFFYEEDIPELRAKAQGTHAEIWDAVKYYADNKLERDCYEWVSSGGNCGASANMVFTLSFAYVISNEEQYLDKARECILVNADPTKWPEWDSSGTRDLYLADMLAKNSLAYDWLYNNFTTADRDIIRESLVRHATEMYEAADYDNNNWTCWWPRSFIQNHRTTNNAALGLTAFAIEGEPGYNQKWLDHVIGQFEIEKYLLEQINEGTWHEGYNYQNALFSPTLPFYINLERLKGIDLLAEEYAQNYIVWKAYNYLPDSEQPAFPIQSVVPDWGWNAGLHHVSLRYLANRFNDGHAEFVAQQILEESTRERYKGHHAPNMVYEFLYYNASVQAQSLVDLPLEAYYPDMGIVTWRTGWGDDDLVFGLKSSKFGGKWASSAYFAGEYPFDMEGAGANVGHNHADANTFFLYKGGTDLSSEKPHRQTWDQSTSWSTTSWHNTVIVDDENQFMFHKQGLQGHDVGGVIEQVHTSENFNYLAADATDTYRYKDNWAPGELMIAEFTRHVLYVKPDYFIIVDNLRSDSNHKYEFVAQIGPLKGSTSQISVSGDWVRGTVGSELLGINVLTPSPFSNTIGTSAVPDGNQNQDKAHIKIRPQSHIDNVRFVTVLYPTTDWNSRPEFSLNADTDDGAVISADGWDHIFRYGPGHTIDSYELKGDAASVKNGHIFVVNTTSLRGSELLFKSAQPVSAEAITSGSTLDLYGDGLDNLTVYAPGITQVRVNDTVQSHTTNRDYMVLGSVSFSLCKIDDNDNGFIENSELLTYLGRWRQGSVSMFDVISAIAQWKQGC